MTHLFGKELLIQFTMRYFVNFGQVFAGNFLFWGRVVGFDCIDSWSLLIPLLWLANLAGPEYIPPDKCHLPCLFFRQLSNELRWLDTFARSCPNANLLFVASYESMWFEYIYITLYALFNVSCDNDFAHAKAHAPIPNFSCLLCTGYCSVLPVNWLLRVLYFA